MTPHRAPLRRFLALLARDQRGATAVEYGLIVAMIVLAMVAALGSLANSTTSMWGKVSNNVANAR